jgi:hypothetical protein
MSKLNPTIIKDRKENRIEMACEGHHPFIVQKYHINQHEVASQDTEISFESGFLQNFDSLCWNNMTCRYN